MTRCAVPFSACYVFTSGANICGIFYSLLFFDSCSTKIWLALISDVMWRFVYQVEPQVAFCERFSKISTSVVVCCGWAYLSERCKWFGSLYILKNSFPWSFAPINWLLVNDFYSFPADFLTHLGLVVPLWCYQQWLLSWLHSQSRGLQAHIFPTSQQVPWGTDWLGPGQTFEHLDVMSRLRKKNNEWYAYSSWWQSTTLKRVLPKFYQHAQILPRQRNTLDHVNRNISIYRIYKYPTDKKKMLLSRRTTSILRNTHLQQVCWWCSEHKDS